MAFRRTINSRKSKNYYVDFWVGDRYTKEAIHINRSTHCDNYEEALVEEKNMRAEAEEQYLIRQGVLSESMFDFTLSQALEWMWDFHWQHNANGQKPYAQITKCIEILNDPPMSAFSGEQGTVTIQRLRTALVGKLNGAGRMRNGVTVDRYLAALRTLLNVVKEHKPMRSLDVPKFPMFNIKNRRERILSFAEEIALFKLMDTGHPEFAQLFKVLLDTGMRLSEALYMNYQKNIMIDTACVSLFSTDVSCKTKTPRTVPLTKRATNILRRRRHTHPTRPFPWTPSRAGQVFRLYRIKMGYGHDKEFVPHMLRHSCTTRMLGAGVPLTVVQAYLGHSNIHMTTWYNHFVVEDLRMGAEVLDQQHEKNYGKDEPIFKKEPNSATEFSIVALLNSQQGISTDTPFQV